jgi:hypothetical protein
LHLPVNNTGQTAAPDGTSRGVTPPAATSMLAFTGCPLHLQACLFTTSLLCHSLPLLSFLTCKDLSTPPAGWNLWQRAPTTPSSTHMANVQLHVHSFCATRAITTTLSALKYTVASLRCYSVSLNYLVLVATGPASLHSISIKPHRAIQLCATCDLSLLRVCAILASHPPLHRAPQCQLQLLAQCSTTPPECGSAGPPSHPKSISAGVLHKLSPKQHSVTYPSVLYTKNPLQPSCPWLALLPKPVCAGVLYRLRLCSPHSVLYTLLEKRSYQ